MSEVVHILGVPVHATTRQAVIGHIKEAVQQTTLFHIVTTNPEFVMQAQANPAFAKTLRNADLSIPDGIGLLIAARRQGKQLPERIPGSELIYHISEAAAENGWSLFLLGAAPGVAEETGRSLQTRYPQLKLAGSYAGSPDAAENDAILSRVNASQADILLVAYGAPKQDLWIARNRDLLTTVRVALGVGGSFDFVTGRSIRAPRWIQRIHLEWLYRLIQEPWRWRRMLALPRFFWHACIRGK